MIIYALNKYYDRLVETQAVPKKGWIATWIDFLIYLDKQGNLKHIEDLREENKKKRFSKIMELPNIGSQAVKHNNSAKDANLLWDNAAFIFGLGKKGDLRLQSMVEVIEEWLGESKDPGIQAVKLFFQKGLADRSHFNLALSHPEYGEELQQGKVKLTFRVMETSQSLVIDTPFVSDALQKTKNHAPANAFEGTCMVTGLENTPIELIHPVIKGVIGAHPAGANLVSFNISAFESYGKSQGLNAPMSQEIVSKYGIALNALLASSNHRFKMGSISVVFWTDQESAFEKDFSLLIKEPEKEATESTTEKIRTFIQAVQRGIYSEQSNSASLYLLGLSPNNARISVRFWRVYPIKQLVQNLSTYFEEFALVKPPKEADYYSVWRILVHAAILSKTENIPTSIAGDFLLSILDGTPYPTTLYQSVIRRIKSDRDYRLNPVRAAFIKAYLNRHKRFNATSNHKELSMSLDRDYPSTGYQLGRMFSVLEKIQETAIPGLNTTILEHRYVSASSTPVSVFPLLLKVKNHHLTKIQTLGKVIFFEKILSEIMSRLHELPAYLDLFEQGRFAIGYYHQRQAFFTSKPAEEKANEKKQGE